MVSHNLNVNHIQANHQSEMGFIYVCLMQSWTTCSESKGRDLQLLICLMLEFYLWILIIIVVKIVCSTPLTFITQGIG